MFICRRAFIHDLFAFHHPVLPLSVRHSASVATRRRNINLGSEAVPFSRPESAYSFSNSSVWSVSTRNHLALDNENLSLKLEAIWRQESMPPKAGAVEVDPDFITPSQYKSLSQDRSTSSPATTESLTQLTVENYLYLFNVFTTQRSAKWINSLLRDIILHPTVPRFYKIEMISQFMSTGDFTLMSSFNILLMTKFLSRSSQGRKQLHQRLFDTLIMNVSKHLGPGGSRRRLMEYLQPLLLAKLGHLDKAPTALNAPSFKPPPLIYSSFLFIDRLIAMGNQTFALDLFQSLVSQHYVPAEALKAASSGVADFGFIVVSGLIRSCLYWYERSLAVQLLGALVKAKGSSDACRDQLYDLSVATILSCLDSPSPSEMLTVVHLIRKVHHFFPVPDSVIRRFYSAVSGAEYGEAASSLYMFTRRPGIQAQHHYPPPQGDVIMPLVNFLASHGYYHFVRLIAQEAVNGTILLPYQSRADFISLVVTSGMAGPARTLWMRYSKSGDAVVGNAGLMIRMVSAFAHLSRKLPVNPTQLSEQDAASDDAAEFSRQVVTKYRELHDPSKKTTHRFAVNALGRAYMILGDFEEGFRILKILVKQRRVPDLADINVAISYFAEHSPEQASKLIELMMERGLDPDGTTFGTVIHWAAFRGNIPLVLALLRQVRQRGVLLTDRTIASIIRALASPSIMRPLTHAARLERLEQVLELMETDLRNMRHLCTPHIAKYLVFASLRTRAGMLGFKFWKLLLKDREDWDDREQRFIRRLIRTQVRSSRVVRELDKDIAS